MSALPELPLAETLAALPPDWPADLLPAIRAARQARPHRLVVLDDDPTGTQSVHGVPVLTNWQPETLRDVLSAPADTGTVYILTNSRSLPAAAARELATQLGERLAAAAQQTAQTIAVISRSDSTLRGHYPVETDALAAALGGYDATLLIPAFLAGGRYTLDDVHYVAEGDRLRPAAATEFARDKAFGYSHSNLRQWVEEKTGGRIPAKAVASISLNDLRLGGPEAVRRRLLDLAPGAVGVINAASEQDLAVAALAALQAEAAGRRLLYRTAASFVPWRAGLAARPLLAPPELGLPPQGGGLIVAGSYVPKTTAQLEALRATGLTSVELNVAALLDPAARDAAIQDAAPAVEAALTAGEDVLLFTSRGLVTGADEAASLDIGRQVSAGLVAAVKAVMVRPRYVLAKGGITSSDTATRALGVRRALVLGQLRPGVPVWRLGPESRWPGLAYIVFPGNVGGPGEVAAVVESLR